ncbi:hypothetical protein B0H19DRAFT_1079710 [Mycena capillaripes]|nr:hypothetical protein B0H19DRAFT_1079710 [Mycena capillaripes]
MHGMILPCLEAILLDRRTPNYIQARAPGVFRDTFPTILDLVLFSQQASSPISVDLCRAYGNSNPQRRIGAQLERPGRFRLAPRSDVYSRGQKPLKSELYLLISLASSPDHDAPALLPILNVFSALNPAQSCLQASTSLATSKRHPKRPSRDQSCKISQGTTARTDMSHNAQTSTQLQAETSLSRKRAQRRLTFKFCQFRSFLPLQYGSRRCQDFQQTCNIIVRLTFNRNATRTLNDCIRPLSAWYRRLGRRAPSSSATFELNGASPPRAVLLETIVAGAGEVFFPGRERPNEISINRVIMRAVTFINCSCDLEGVAHRIGILSEVARYLPCDSHTTSREIHLTFDTSLSTCVSGALSSDIEGGSVQLGIRSQNCRQWTATTLQN